MAFDNSAVFPLGVKNEHITPVWSSSIAKMGGGTEVRNAWWSDPLRRIEFDLGVITLANFHTFEKHFNARRGRLRGFPYQSKTKFQATTEAVGTGDGATAAFQLQVAEGDASNAYAREIYKVVALSETVFVNAVAKTRTTHYTINNNTGLITFTGGNIPTGGQVITATFQFYIPVRYDMDSIDDMELFIFVSGGQQLVSVSGVRLVETRDIA
jgi:uncharacterized protein (TIGR02217 family)